MYRNILYHIYIFIWIITNGLIVSGNFHGIIHFGLGLGDVLYSVIIITASILLIVYFIVDTIKKKGFNHCSKENIIIALISFLFSVYVILKMTYLRESISEWNGEIFPGLH